MSGTLRRAAAALLRWGPGAGGVGLRGAGVRAAGAGTGAGGGGQAEQLDALVKKDKVVVFLKGTPEQPQCGFSNAVVQILRLHGVRDYAAYNVLDDPELRQDTEWLRMCFCRHQRLLQLAHHPAGVPQRRVRGGL
ncbi:glutaredoxin-related protein 5, mitochondrial isoform X3 [Heterocephalus glaber]|uniref:Glutaredoxin-related protein 5, mitochondrial isoform X3 n=1 Tax=Heterocephalus glaber TaxID=10181 RepID=A0AAX6RUR4_HETGA|nr:glutaredoxin-related protein 5, mitochondrial isoform X3 [Heterocephalus glaber]